MQPSAVLLCMGSAPAPTPAPPPARRHLPKNFDNIHNLEFKKDAQGNPTKVAVGMYSGGRAGGRVRWAALPAG